MDQILVQVQNHNPFSKKQVLISFARLYFRNYFLQNAYNFPNCVAQTQNVVLRARVASLWTTNHAEHCSAVNHTSHPSGTTRVAHPSVG